MKTKFNRKRVYRGEIAWPPESDLQETVRTFGDQGRKQRVRDLADRALRLERDLDTCKERLAELEPLVGGPACAEFFQLKDDVLKLRADLVASKSESVMAHSVERLVRRAAIWLAWKCGYVLTPSKAVNTWALEAVEWETVAQQYTHDEYMSGQASGRAEMLRRHVMYHRIWSPPNK